MGEIMADATIGIAAALAEREHALIRSLVRYSRGVNTLPDKLGALRAAVSTLESAGASYALIGGLAVGVRSGIPRATLDIDFAVSTKTDLEGLVARLATAGFTLVGRFAHSINFKHSSGEPLQLAFDPAFDTVVERAEALSLGELTLFVVTKEDLIAMKRRAAADPARRRSKALRDQADIALLEGDTPDPDEGW
jgi:hypothetical protein